MAEATAADYAWFKDHWLHEAFCITLVRGADGVEVLRRFGGEQGQLRTLTLGEAGELSGSFQAGYPQLVLAARSGGWTVAVEDNGWEGTRPEVLWALSRGTRAVSVYRNVHALSLFRLAVDGALVVQFEPLFPGCAGAASRTAAAADARGRPGPRLPGATPRRARHGGAGPGRAGHGVHLPGDPGPVVRAEALAVLRSGGGGGPPRGGPPGR
jgi:Family of unknown function (DUF6461)